MGVEEVRNFAGNVSLEGTVRINFKVRGVVTVKCRGKERRGGGHRKQWKVV